MVLFWRLHITSRFQIYLCRFYGFNGYNPLVSAKPPPYFDNLFKNVEVYDNNFVKNNKYLLLMNITI